MFGFVGAMIGGINGGLLYSRLSNLTFRETNDATVFESRGVAHRKMLDTMTLSFARGAVRFGIRYGIFCFGLSYVLILITIIHTLLFDRYNLISYFSTVA